MELRVWWQRNNVYVEEFKVYSIQEAVELLKQLEKEDLENHSVFTNSGGLKTLDEDGDWVEYYDEHGKDIDEIMEEMEVQSS